MLGYQRRTAVLAMAVAVALAGLVGCSDDGKPTKVLGEVIERSGASDASAAPASTSTTAAPTTTTAPTPTTAAPAPTTAQPITPAPTTPAPEPDPGPTEAPAPPPIIEWRYQVPEGSTATATIDGPSGHIVKQIVNGGAVFDGLLEGTYEMVLEVDTPTPPTDTTGATLGPASTTSRGRAEVHAGDHVFIDCSGYGDCNGVA